MSYDGILPVDTTRLTRFLAVWETGCATYFLRPGEQATLGRQPDCEMLIRMPSVSRRHARVTAASGSDSTLATIEDVGGMNGVLVRGRRIPVNTAVAVSAGDVIELPGVVLVLHPAAPADRPSAGPFAHAPALSPAREDPMKAVERLLGVVAQSDLDVLFVGEPGVGKTFGAEAIHASSARAGGPLVRLDCGALPDGLIDGELFGWEAGAFDGADEPKAGSLEAARGGTVLLDEIGAMPLATQAKLEAALEAREVVPLGGDRPRPVDVRVVASNSYDLLERVTSGAFRRGLYERLAAIRLIVPPLRERKGEISRFAAKFLAEAAKRAGRPAPRLSNEALGLVLHHPFPGNLRELKSTMERACMLARSGYVGAEHLFFDTPIATRATSKPPIPSTRRLAAPMTPTEPPTAPTEEVAIVPILVPPAPKAPAIPLAPAPAPAAKTRTARARKR